MTSRLTLKLQYSTQCIVLVEKIDKKDQWTRTESLELDPHKRSQSTNLRQRSKGNSMVKRQALQQMVLEQLHIHMQTKQNNMGMAMPF